MSVPLQFASFYNGQEVFVWLDRLLDFSFVANLLSWGCGEKSIIGACTLSLLTLPTHALAVVVVFSFIFGAGVIHLSWLLCVFMWLCIKG